MASPRTWTIVHFIEDNSVEAVPTKWINGTRCLWPLLPPEKLGAAIRRQEFNTHWPDSPVRVLRNATFGDYATARSKAKKAEDFSDLNSTDPEDEKRMDKLKIRRRVLKKRVLSSEEEDCSDDDRPLVKKKMALKTLPPPPLWVESEKEVNTSFDMPIQDFDSTEALISPKSNEVNNFGTNTSGTELASKPSGHSSRESVLSLRRTQENTPKISKKKEVEKELPAKKSATGNTNCVCSSSAVLFNIQNILVEIKATVDSLAGGNASRPQEHKVDILKKSKINFPIASEVDLAAMELFLEEEGNYSALVSFFSKMGGYNVYEFIKRCIAPLLSDKVAIDYSYLGRKGKKRFDKLALSKAILESAEIANIAKTKKETETNISIWLRKARERKARAKAKNNNNENQ